MTYVAPYVDASGLHIPTYQDILDDLIASMKAIYGTDIYLENDSADYQLLSIFALKQYDTLQALAYAYNSRSPETAIGASLDSVVKLNGIARKPAGYSTCQVKLTGIAFTQISDGVVQDSAGVNWNLPSTVIIGSDGTATTTATCSVPGAVSALVGAIDKIVTPTYGWVSVTNTAIAVVGNAEETDAELRIRQAASVANPSQTMLEGTRGGILACANVTRCACYENDTNLATVSDSNPYGLPPHSVTCVVEGGADADIAAAILYHKGIGCYTNGTTVVPVTDSNEFVNTIRFYRPTYKTVYVKVVVKKYPGYVTSVLTAVQEAIVAYLKKLTIGSDVSLSMLTGVAIACNADISNPTFGISTLKIGLVSGSEAAEDIVINYNEIPVCSAANVEVTAP